MKTIVEAIADVCAETHVPMAQEVFGGPGLDSIFKVMASIQKVYQVIEPERIRGHLIVFQVVNNIAGPVGGPAHRIPIDLTRYAGQLVDNLVFELSASGDLFHLDDQAITAEALAARAIVYKYQNGNEEFLAGDRRKMVLRLDLSAKSQFSVPTLSNLREALQIYGVESVSESTCYIFAEAWATDNRLFFRSGAEKYIRRSLTQFLRNRLSGGYDVWPEQNVNEKNPVDIRIQPKFNNNRLMLVEIKWLGFSVADDDAHITARHLQHRAQEGAEQLAEYLDEQRQFAPGRVIQGYYVIIDGRRKDLKEGSTTISRADGLHFENIDLTFDPAPHITRSDFDPPYRMFARPICQD